MVVKHFKTIIGTWKSLRNQFAKLKTLRIAKYIKYFRTLKPELYGHEDTNAKSLLKIDDRF